MEVEGGASGWVCGVGEYFAEARNLKLELCFFSAKK